MLALLIYLSDAFYLSFNASISECHGLQISLSAFGMALESQLDSRADGELRELILEHYAIDLYTVRGFAIAVYEVGSNGEAPIEIHTWADVCRGIRFAHSVYT